jgi:hypothetical protein
MVKKNIAYKKEHTPNDNNQCWMLIQLRQMRLFTKRTIMVFVAQQLHCPPRIQNASDQNNTVFT